MSARLVVAFMTILTLVACGGSPPAGSQAPAGSHVPTGATGTPGASAPASEAPPTGGSIGGQSLDSEGVRASLTALQALDSWTFQGTYWTKVLGEASEQSVTGTERRKPQVAVDATHHGPTGDYRYIRIGDTIWVDLGTGSFTQANAPDSPNLVDQYEPLYIAALVSTALGSTVTYDAIAEETVNGIPATHYQLAEDDKQNLANLVGLTPEQLAGDLWLAKDGGYLVGFAWGPQSVDTAGPFMGFKYEVTSVNCTCPVAPPT
jgi:hypothetical protein